MQKHFLTTTIAAFALASSTACATKGFVGKEVSQIAERVEALSESLEDTQERTRTNAARIGEVDQKADQVGLWAKDAGASAATARTAADKANAVAAAADARAIELDVKSQRLLFEVVLSEDQGNFKFGAAELPEEVKARIDELVAELKADPKGAFVEIEGHTDSLGEKEVNTRLGLARADAVKRYLYEAHQVPLHKMNVISFGEERPVAPNDTREGRARNRRVIIKVLA